MIYFTSDLHFYHNKEFVYANRGFDNVYDMNEEIIKRYNQIIRPDDEVYILGDCVLNDTAAGVCNLKRLNGRKYLAVGNHDTENKIMAYKECEVFEDIQVAYRLKYRHKGFIAQHYPCITCNPNDPNTVYSIHGHTHQTNTFTPGYLNMYHIGVDSHNLEPVSIEQICNDIIRNKEA